MNTSFEKTIATDEWYTPPEFIHSLGAFDLDPCTSNIAFTLNHSANNYYTKEDNGLLKEWSGRVWLNPPYSRPLIEQFICKMAEHNNGIALLYNRLDNKMFHDIIFPNADSIFFLRQRIRFLRPDGTTGGSPGCGSVLVSFGCENTKAILKSGLKGYMMKKTKN